MLSDKGCTVLVVVDDSHIAGGGSSELGLKIGEVQTVGFPGGASGKEPTCQCRFDPWVRKILWRWARQPTLVFLPGESQGQRSLVGYGS